MSMNTSDDDNLNRLLASAEAYLLDARNLQLSAHTRLSSAMNALGTLCTAGIGGDDDRSTIDTWERARYETSAWPPEEQVADAIKYVSQMLQNFKARR